MLGKGNMKKNKAEVRETMTKLEKAGYRQNPKKCEFLKKEIKWLSHELNTTTAGQLNAITKMNIPKKENSWG